jgi:hypothetical protein
MTTKEKQTLDVFFQSANGATNVDQMLAIVSKLKDDAQSFSNNAVQSRVSEQAEYIYKIIFASKTRASRRG